MSLPRDLALLLPRAALPQLVRASRAHWQAVAAVPEVWRSAKNAPAELFDACPKLEWHLPRTRALFTPERGMRLSRDGRRVLFYKGVNMGYALYDLERGEEIACYSKPTTGRIPGPAQWFLSGDGARVACTREDMLHLGYKGLWRHMRLPIISAHDVGFYDDGRAACITFAGNIYVEEASGAWTPRYADMDSFEVAGETLAMVRDNEVHIARGDAPVVTVEHGHILEAALGDRGLFYVILDDTRRAHVYDTATGACVHTTAHFMHYPVQQYLYTMAPSADGTLVYMTMTTSLLELVRIDGTVRRLCAAENVTHLGFRDAHVWMMCTDGRHKKRLLTFPL